jgi:protease I
MKTVVLIIAEKTFRDEEYQVPKEVLTRAGTKVITASTTTGEAVGKLGLKVRPDILIDQVDIDKLDALIFIGGAGSSQYFNDPLAHKLAIDAAQKGKIYGAICIAPTILANAGLLKGKKATVFPSPDGIEALKKGGAVYTSNDVEMDGRLITGCGPEAAEKFGEELVKMLHP